MTLSSDISTTSTSLSDIKNAIIAKGVTPTGNITTYAAAIGNIEHRKFGASIDALLGDVDANGVLQSPTGSGNIVFTGVVSLPAHSLAHKFKGSHIQSISLPDLTSIVNEGSMEYICYNCDYLITVDLSKVESISVGFEYSFNSCSMLSSVNLDGLKYIICSESGKALSHAFEGNNITVMDFKNLESVTGAYSAMSYCFNSSNVLTTVYFRKLATVQKGSNSVRAHFYYCFAQCDYLSDIYFYALTTTSFTGSGSNVFNNMFSPTTGRYSTNGGCTVHFPSNLSSVISSLNGYPIFGGNSSYITIAFDLPATS